MNPLPRVNDKIEFSDKGRIIKGTVVDFIHIIDENKKRKIEILVI